MYRSFNAFILRVRECLLLLAAEQTVMSAGTSDVSEIMVQISYFPSSWNDGNRDEKRRSRARRFGVDRRLNDGRRRGSPNLGLFRVLSAGLHC